MIIENQKVSLELHWAAFWGRFRVACPADIWVEDG